MRLQSPRHIWTGLDPPCTLSAGEEISVGSTQCVMLRLTALAWGANEKESQSSVVTGRFTTLLLCLLTTAASPGATPPASSLSLAGIVLPRHVVEQGAVYRDENSLLQHFF